MNTHVYEYTFVYAYTYFVIDPPPGLGTIIVSCDAPLSLSSPLSASPAPPYWSAGAYTDMSADPYT